MGIVEADRPRRVASGEDDVLLREGIARILTDAVHAELPVGVLGNQNPTQADVLRLS